MTAEERQKLLQQRKAILQQIQADYGSLDVAERQVANLAAENAKLKEANASLTKERDAALSQAKGEKARADTMAGHPDVVAAAKAAAKQKAADLQKLADDAKKAAGL